MAADQPHVVASVLNWNNYDDTAACLRSLEQLNDENLEIVLVDNGSTDGSIDRLAEEFPNLGTIRNEQNLGFSGGHNAAIEYALSADADYIWILNNDVVVPEDCLNRLVSRIEQHPNLGIVIPQVMEGEDVWFKHGRVNRRSGGSNAGPIAQYLRRFSGDESSDELIDNDYVPFCCTLFDIEVFETVGTFPEAYFLYMEDVDFCLRVADHGYRIVTATSITVDHEATSSSGGAHNPIINYYIARNRWILARRIDSVRWHWFVPAYLAWLGKRSGLALTAGKWDGFIALFEGALDGLVGGQGRGRYP